MPKPYDAIVVGSGISGGWAAKELTERGLRHARARGGRPDRPGQGLRRSTCRPGSCHFRGYGDRQKLAREQPVQKDCYACDEWGSKFFVNDLENPYTTDRRQAVPLDSRPPGGRALASCGAARSTAGATSTSRRTSATGIGVDWPIRYADIAPWYGHVERFIGVSGETRGPAPAAGRRVPPADGAQLRRETCAGQRVTSGASAASGSSRSAAAPILTQDHNGRAACHYCGPCERGCITRSLLHQPVGSTLPAAAATGRLTLRPHSVVHSLIYDPTRRAGRRGSASSTRRPKEHDASSSAPDHLPLRLDARVSTRILLNSKPARFPNGLANSSGQLGRNLMDHHFMGGGASGDDPRAASSATTRATGPTASTCRASATSATRDEARDFIRGYGYQGGGGRSDWGRGGSDAGFGAEFKASLWRPGRGASSFYGFGECLP